MRVEALCQSYQERFPSPSWEEKQKQNWLRICIICGLFGDQSVQLDLSVVSFNITITLAVVITRTNRCSALIMASRSSLRNADLN
jgi:hypothetical protein